MTENALLARLLELSARPALRVIDPVGRPSRCTTPRSTRAATGAASAIGIARRAGSDHQARPLSQLAHLPRWRPGRLKFDCVIVAMLDAGPEHSRAADANLSLRHWLGLRLIIEAVESAPALARLFGLGDDEAQRHFVRAPLAPGDLPAWLGGRS